MDFEHVESGPLLQAVGGYCKEGEGDCDDDAECEGELVCGINNCAWNSTFDDCCANPGKLCSTTCAEQQNLYCCTV